MRHLWACICLAGALVAAQPAAWAAPRPFQILDGQVVVTITVKDRELPALLDTGATESLIDKDLADELGIRSRQVGRTYGASGRKTPFGRTQDVMIDIGAGPVRRSLGTYQVSHAFAPEGVRILIGMDLLQNTAVALDFQKMTVEIQPSTKIVPPVEKPFPLKLNWDRPTLLVDLGGAEAELLLDTAASVSLHLSRSFVQDTPQLKDLPASRRRIVGIDGAHEQDAIIVPHIAFGGRSFAGVPASIAPPGNAMWGNARYDTKLDGIIGVGLLRRFNVLMDFGRRLVWMTPIPAPS